ncbi:MAG: sodium:proline symporter [Ectothiorhodospiraceae bacterium]|nr:sodium:proline symporter [Ectothiorhodospiraceae bacterium]MCH8504816.1 sodium:proline symporter [Ectothiorhodospiraceae bacterium]
MPGIHSFTLVSILAALAVMTVVLAPRVRTADGFFRGWGDTGDAPGVLTLTFSQVTTWIFARSLLNAGILGYFFGIAGALAYTAYYGSFLTGWLIVDRLRYRHGAENLQGFLELGFGKLGTACFNLLISLRLLTEVFANLLVVGIVFGAAGSNAYTAAILAVAVITLLYSMTGGLRASLRTDVTQMAMLVALLLILFVMMLLHPQFNTGAIAASSPDLANPGWILLMVALLQVLSYPMHDPVMMDRGFLADRSTTRRSFLHAFWISALCILAFGLLGVFAGLNRVGEEELLMTLERLLGAPAMLVLALALVISAASTMDSTFASASKMAVVDMRLAAASPRNGRLAMLLFCIGGLVLVFIGTDDLFSAVAVSGTASLFLTPVIVYNILAGREVHRWSFFATFLVAVGGSALYFLESSGYTNLVTPLTGVEHNYSKLLIITLVILVVGFAAFAMGLKRKRAT